jgi:hypothetical protein
LPQQPEVPSQLYGCLRGCLQQDNKSDAIELIEKLLASGASAREILSHLPSSAPALEDTEFAKLQAARDTAISHPLPPMAGDTGTQPERPVDALPSTGDRLSALSGQESSSSNPPEGPPFSPKLGQLAGDQVEPRALLPGRRQQLFALCLATAVVGGGAAGAILLQRAPADGEDRGGSKVVAIELPERSFAPITPAKETSFRHSEIVFPAGVEAAANSSRPSLAALSVDRGETPAPAAIKTAPRQRPSGVTPQTLDRGATNSERTRERHSSDRVANRLNGEERRRHALRPYFRTTYSRPPAYRQRVFAAPLRSEPPGWGYSPYYAGWVAPSWARRLPY